MAKDIQIFDIFVDLNSMLFFMCYTLIDNYSIILSPIFSGIKLFLNQLFLKTLKFWRKYLNDLLIINVYKVFESC